MQITALFSLMFSLSLASDMENEKSRKHYGMSFHVQCENYVKSFTCMSACKSIGFQVFRMDRSCKCSCHELKTTTILPFFKWLTNGTTVQWHKTQSVPLYHVVGTLSPPTYMDYNAMDEEGTGKTEGGAGPGQTTESGATGDGDATTSADGATAEGDAPDAAPGGEPEGEAEDAEGEPPAGEPEAEEEQEES